MGTSSAEALKTLRRLDTTLRWTQATAPSGSQILRHSVVSAITCTGRPDTRYSHRMRWSSPGPKRACTSDDFSDSQRGTGWPLGVGRPSGMVWAAPASTAAQTAAAVAASLWKRGRALLDTQGSTKLKAPNVRAQA